MQDFKQEGYSGSLFDDATGPIDVGMSVGQAINTPSGVTVIPISKVSFGRIGGALDSPLGKSSSATRYGGASGSGATVTPVGFLTVSPTAEIKLITIEGSGSVDKIGAILDQAPDIIERIKNILS